MHPLKSLSFFAIGALIGILTAFTIQQCDLNRQIEISQGIYQSADERPIDE